MSFNGTVADNCTQDNPSAVQQIVFQISGEQYFRCAGNPFAPVFGVFRASVKIWVCLCVCSSCSTQLYCKWQVSQVCMCNKVKLCHVTRNIRSEKRFSKMSVTSSQQRLSPGIASIHPHFPIVFLYTLYCVVCAVFHLSCCGPHMLSCCTVTNLQQPKYLIEDSIGTGIYQ